jgi:hypothetical protein
MTERVILYEQVMISKVFFAPGDPQPANTPKLRGSENSNHARQRPDSLTGKSNGFTLQCFAFSYRPDSLGAA